MFVVYTYRVYILWDQIPFAFFSHSTQSLESMTFGLIATGQLTPWSRQSVFASSWGTGISYLFCMQAIGKASLCPLLFSTKGILCKSKRVGPAIPFCHTMVIVSAGTRSVLLKHPPNMEDQSERYPFLQFLPRCGKLVNQWAPLQDVPSCEFTQKGQLDKSQKEWRPKNLMQFWCDITPT
jgi:hypothetical protein